DLVVLSSSDVLVAARVELHRRRGRATDQLTLQEQDGVARALGLDDADSLMRVVSTAARTIGWASDDAWLGIGRWLDGPGRRRVVVRRGSPCVACSTRGRRGGHPCRRGLGPVRTPRQAPARVGTRAKPLAAQSLPPLHR